MAKGKARPSSPVGGHRSPDVPHVLVLRRDDKILGGLTVPPTMALGDAKGIVMEVAKNYDAGTEQGWRDLLTAASAHGLKPAVVGLVWIP